MKKQRIILVLLLIQTTLHAQLFPPQKAARILKKQEGAIVCLTFDPEGKVLASGSDDKTCVLFSFFEGKVLNTLTGYTDAVRAILYTPDARWLITGGDRNVRIFKPDGTPVNAYTGPATHIWSMGYDAGTNTVVCGSYDKNIRMVDLENGKVTSLMGHTKNALAVAFSHQGKTIASGSLDQTVRIWDAATKKELHTCNGHGGNIYAVLFSADDRLIFSASNDNSIRVWDAATGETVHHLIGHEKGVSSIALSPDGNYLISGSYDGTVRLWDWVNDECIATLTDAPAEVFAVAFHPDGKTVAAGYADKLIRIWDIQPDIFVEHYYGEAVRKEAEQSPLFQPKGKDESKTDYKIRQDKAQTYRKELIDKYYNQYLRDIKGKKRTVNVQ